jgi:hypothetical protein
MFLPSWDGISTREMKISCPGFPSAYRISFRERYLGQGEEERRGEKRRGEEKRRVRL